MAVVALAAWAGCSGSGRGGLPPLEELNVLLVVIDTLGAEHVSCLGPSIGPPTTPALDRLAAGGVLFDRAYSPAPWTQPAVASLFTGEMPSSHRVLRLFDRLDPAETTLAERLAGRGFATAGVVSHELLDSRYGFDQGFAHFDASAAGGHRTVSSPEVTAKALGWLDRWLGGGEAREGAGGRPPFFLFVHYFDPHYVYLHHERFSRTRGYGGPLTPGMDIWALRDARAALTPADVGYLRDLYREEVAFTDFHLGRLLAGLRQRGLERDTLVVVTADHGEELMRHGWIGHTRTLYDELLRVPLVVSLPGRIAPRRVEEPVSLVDLVPTLLELSGRAEQPAEVEEGRPAGISLVPALTGGAPPPADRDLFAEVSFATRADDPAKFAEKTAFKTAVLSGPWKLVHDLAGGSWQLYDRRSDPEELHDLAPAAGAPAAGGADGGESEPATRALRRLQRRLAAWERERGGAPDRATSAVDPSAEELERLRALGYLR
jgi:arylsulfatase A-like enzyme